MIEGCLVPDYKNRLQSVDDVLRFLPASIDLPQIEVSNDDFAKMPSHISGYLLRIMQGEEYGKTYDLTALAKHSFVLRMGRYDMFVQNDIPIIEQQSVYISRKHCTIEFDQQSGVWFVRDGQWDNGTLGGWKHSLNGTFVNAKEISQDGYFLSHGDILSIGDTKLRFEAY